MSFRWLKSYTPRSLYGRAILILLLPVVSLFLVVAVVFTQRHFEGVTRQMTHAVSREVNLILDSGLSAEEVARSPVTEAKAYLEAGVPVGRHLADQLMLPLAMAGSGSFRTLPLSAHAITQIEIIETFLGRRLSWEQLGEAEVRVHA